MQSPLKRDVFFANSMAVATGVQAKRVGATGLEAVNIGLSWRWWYKNMTAANIMMVIVTIYAINQGGWMWAYPVAQAVVNTVVCMITYYKLVSLSGFKQRLAFRISAPLGRHFPYTARFWLYCALFLPCWAIVWVDCATAS